MVKEKDIENAYNNPDVKVFKVYDEHGNMCYVPKMWVKVTIMKPKNQIEQYAYSQPGDKRRILMGMIAKRWKEYNKPYASIDILETAYQREYGS